ncbi:MAG TPA: phage major capsid protein [Sphingobium sp.]|nr:phage major capsid protein [Sphingobium sp.]
MKWFGRKGAGMVPRPPLGRGWAGCGWGGGHGGDWPQSYEAQLREAALANPVAQRALRLVSEAAGSAALTARATRPEDAAAALALVRRRAAGQSLVETLAAHLLLHGNGYVQIGHGADGLPASLYALRPERVRIEADAQGWPRAYLYRAGETATRYASEDATGRTAIVHLKALNPTDDHYGLGCLGAAAGAVAIHNAATRWNKALLDNAARPSGALVYAGEDGQVLRKFKTADGAFLWQPSLTAGQPATLLGYPVVEAEDMPDIAADSLSIAFGNFQRGYVIAERGGTSILRDPFTNKPFVNFYAVQRIGGGVANSEAIKLMKFAAS